MTRCVSSVLTTGFDFSMKTKILLLFNNEEANGIMSLICPCLKHPYPFEGYVILACLHYK